jgi:hypothetical protein
MSLGLATQKRLRPSNTVIRLFMKADDAGNKPRADCSNAPICGGIT